MKDYLPWHEVKKELEGRKNIPQFSEGEIWWCAIGLNVGYEENGKNHRFERPICIMKKFNKEIFIGLPMTSTSKTNRFYFPYTLRDSPGSFVLSQSRLLSVKRLERRLGRMEQEKFKELTSAFHAILK